MTSKSVRALVYGHANLNLIDGSAVWVQSVVQVFSAAGCDVTLVLKAPVETERGDIGEIVGRAVQALGPLQREVVILAEYEGLTLAEIARAVDADVGTVKSRLHRARENLRRTLAPLRSRLPTTA